MESTTYKTMDSFANIFMTTTLSKTVFRTTVWKYYIHDIFCLWDMSKPDIEAFIEQANLHHPTIEFTVKTFDTETAFFDTVVYKGTRFKEKSILDAKTHLKQTETFTHLVSPSKCEKRICQRRSLENPTQKLLRNNLRGK